MQLMLAQGAPMITFSLPSSYEYYERLVQCFIQGSLLTTAALFVFLSRNKKMGTTPHSRWLVLLNIFVVTEAITYAIATLYALFNTWEPEPLNSILDTVDSLAFGAFLWAVVLLWKIARHTPGLLKNPWLNAPETPEGVWPPTPKVH